MSIELPKDAEGREIPLDTECLYTHDGEKRDVFSFVYYRRKDKWEIETDAQFINSIHFYITPPDSWEKLEEDLDKGEDICDYFEGCPEDMYGKSCSECKKAALKNIASRIRKLRGEDE